MNRNKNYACTHQIHTQQTNQLEKGGKEAGLSKEEYVKLSVLRNGKLLIQKVRLG